MENVGEDSLVALATSEEVLLRIAAEKAKRASDDKYEKIFRIISDAICVSGIEDKLIHEVNPAFLKMFGFSEEEIIGRSSLDFEIWYDPHDRHVVMSEIRRVGCIQNYEGRFRTKTGGIGYGKLSANVIDNNGTMQLISVIHDVTEQKLREEALRESEAKLQRLNEEITKLSITDPLTGLFNRRHFFSIITSEIECCQMQKHRKPPSIMVADIDHFKSINDLYGHTAGDQVLVHFAEVLRSCVRKVDSLYRYGGEEFVIILPSTTKDDAFVVAEKIRGKFKEARFPFILDQNVRKTVSIGVAEYREGETMESLFNRADGCLYSAKENGRDSVNCKE